MVVEYAYDIDDVEKYILKYFMYFGLLIVDCMSIFCLCLEAHLVVTEALLPPIAVRLGESGAVTGIVTFAGKRLPLSL